MQVHATCKPTSDGKFEVKVSGIDSSKVLIDAPDEEKIRRAARQIMKSLDQLEREDLERREIDYFTVTI
jgi:hypothetical protein